MYMDNKLYDILKWFAQIVLPAAASLYFGLSPIWNLPNATEVVGTLIAFDVFLGAVLGLSAMEYDKARLREGDFAPVLGTGADYTVQASDMPWDLPSDVYDRLKWIALIVLPASGTLYLALSGFWGFPYGDQVVGTVAVITTFLGALLGVSTVAHNRSIRP